MSISEDELINQARRAMKNAYAPYSKFRVGAALLTDDGQIYTGCNVENSSYGAANCAERTAVFTAVCHGARKFQKIAIIADSTEPVKPCGICRQVLFEFSPKMEIITIGASGTIERVRLDALLPHGFRIKPAQEPKNK